METFGLSLAEVHALEMWQYAILCDELDKRMSANAPGEPRGVPVMR